MSATADLQTRRFTVEEYFQFLDENEGKYEYHDGEIRMMAGGTDDHSKIKTDLNAFLNYASREGGCEPYDSDMAVSIPLWNTYVLPDLSFVCDGAKFGDEARRRLLNPSLLVEVISESSGDYDRGEKFQKYRSLDSFKEYMLIDSRRYAVECWYKEEEKLWRMDSAFTREESVYLHTLDVHLPLAEIYRRVHF